MSVSNTTHTILFLLIPDNRTNNRGGERWREAAVGVLLGFAQRKRLEGRDSSRAAPPGILPSRGEGLMKVSASLTGTRIKETNHR